MSSKRGRKRNDNLPPNRARDVQRAFRARRAAHLQALEQRVAELEEENSCLRQALNLPQANRPPLGKGPTGKDKPKSAYETDNHHPLHSSRDSSTDSPESMRESLSPVLLPASLPAAPPRSAIQELEEGTGPWGQTIVMTEEVPHYQALPPMSAPPALSTKIPPYSPSPHPSSRSSSLAPMYMYGSNDRISAYPGYFEQQQQQQQQQQRSYSYSQQHPQQQQQHPQSPYSPVDSPVHEVPASLEAQAVAMGYPPQRRRTEPQLQTLGAHFPHTPPIQPVHIRLPSPPRGLQEQHPHEVHDMHDMHGHHSQLDPHAHHRPAYTADGRIIS